MFSLGSLAFMGAQRMSRVPVPEGKMGFLLSGVGFISGTAQSWARRMSSLGHPNASSPQQSYTSTGKLSTPSTRSPPHHQSEP